MLDEQVWLTVSPLIHTKGMLLGWGQDSVGQSSSFTPNWLIHVFMDLAFCTGAQSCWSRREASQNSHKCGSMKLSKMCWYAEAFRVPFTGIKVPSPTAEKRRQTMLPSPNTCVTGRRHDRTMIQHSVTFYSLFNLAAVTTRLCCSSLAANHTYTQTTNWDDPVQSINPARCDCGYPAVAFAYPAAAPLTTPHHNLAQCSQTSTVLLATAKLLTPLCDFKQPTTVWVSCYSSQSLPLFYNTTNSWLWNI